jgi:hypothetical protein
MSAHALPKELGEAPYEIVDPGSGRAISVVGWTHLPLTIAASTAETNTLASPTKAGQRLSIIAVSVGSSGTRAITVATAVNQAGNTVLTFNAQFDACILESFPVGSGLYRWRIVHNESVGLS